MPVSTSYKYSPTTTSTSSGYSSAIGRSSQATSYSASSSLHRPPISYLNPIASRSKSIYDLSTTRSLSSSYSSRAYSPCYSSLNSSSSVSSSSSTSSGSLSSSPSFRGSNNVSGLSSSPCSSSVTLTRFNQRRASFDYNDNATDSSSSSPLLKSTILPSYSGFSSPLTRRKKYTLKKEDENYHDDDDMMTRYKSKVTNLNGLTNLGNTCYMNSALQALYATQAFRDYITTSSGGSLFNALSRLFSDLANSSTYINPSSFRSQFIRYQPKFRGHDQQDAQEFLRYLINGLHDEVNRVKRKPKMKLIEPKTSDEAWEQYKNNIDDSPLIDLLVGQYTSVIRCSICMHVSTCWDPFWDISLPLCPNTRECDIERCIKLFTSPEELDNEEKPICSQCSRPTRSTKRLTIEKTPQILILHLKRFSNDGYKLLTPNVVVNPSIYLSSKRYTLYGCVSHHGNSSRSGHYTAHCMHNSKWYHFNDEKVSEAKNFTPSELGDAYVLFYKESSTSRL